MIHGVSQTQSGANMMEMEHDELLVAGEIMKALKISRPTFWRMRTSGELPVVKVGGRWKMSRRVLNEYLRAVHGDQTTKPGARGGAKS